VVFPGVYRLVAAPTTPAQTLRAACLATRGVASHASAAWVWGLLAQPPALPEVTITRGQWDTRDQRVVVHRSRDLNMEATSTRNGIPVTKPLRTLVDLAGAALPAQLTEAVDNALAQRLVTPGGLEAEIERLSRPGRGGVGVLKRHLARQGFLAAPPPTVLEAHARRLIRTTGLSSPTPELCVGEDGEYRLDLAWDHILLTVEVDGYAWHFSPEQKRRDETRRQRLRAAGWTVLVYDWHQIVSQSAVVAKEIVATYERLAPDPTR